MVFETDFFFLQTRTNCIFPRKIRVNILISKNDSLLYLFTVMDVSTLEASR